MMIKMYERRQESKVVINTKVMVENIMELAHQGN